MFNSSFFSKGNRSFSLMLWIMIFPLGRIFAQVNLPTGATQVNIPLYSYSDKNRLSLSVALQYVDGNGVKVNELSSNVGLGWRLNFGGGVSRVMVGKPDDQYGNVRSNRQGTGRLYANYGSPTDCFNEVGLTDPEYNAIDREADLFNFDLNGRTGTFVISRKAQGETSYKIRTLDDSKLKIELLEEDMPNILTRISRFMITTEDAIQYVFAEKELTEIVTTDRNISTEPTINPGMPILLSPGDAPPTPEQITIRPYRTEMYIINNWYLSEIRNVLTGARINFEYATYNLDFSLMKLPVKTETLNSDNTIDKINYTIFDQRFLGQMKHINRIIFPENKQMEFVYVGNRWDIPGDSALSVVNIKSGNSITNSFAFNYQYHDYTALRDYNSTFTETGKQNLRLSLLSVDKNIGQRSTFVSFDYCSGVVPPRGSPQQDYYGYYNGNVMNVRQVGQFFDMSLRQPNANAQNGLLKRVTYPAGGYLEYEYEPRTVTRNDMVKMPGGVRVKKTTVYDGIDHANDQINTYKYITDEGAPSGMGFEEPFFSEDGSTYYVTSGTHLLSKVLFVAINLTINPSSPALYAVPVLTASQGQGLLKVIDDIVSFVAGDSFQTGTIKTRSTSGYALFAHNLLPVVYERVEVIQGNDTKNIGKIVYNLTSYLDGGVLIPSMLLPCSYAQRAEEWRYGLPKTTSYYDAAGKLVRQEDYTYQFQSQTLNIDTTWVSCKCGPKDKVIPTSVAGVNKNRISFNTGTYYPVTGRAELIKQTTKQFYLDNNFSTETTSYEYDPVYYTVRKVTTENSNKETLEKRMYYPGNYNTSAYGYQQRMMTFNMVGVPVATETWIVKEGSPAKLLNAQISEFTQIQNADILPVATYELMSAKPLDQSTIGVFDPSKLNRAPAYFKKTTASVYDSEGNLVQEEVNGNVTSYIYAYDVVNGKTTGRLVAAVTNAALSEVAFSGFETTGTKGGWLYSGPQLYHIVPPPGQPTVQSPDPVTGNFYYGLGTGSNAIVKESGLVEGKKYKLTYWVRGGFLAGSDPVVNLNYSSTIKQGPVQINNYTYYEREFTAGSAELEVTGSGYVDDIRLFPSDAQMVTYDYDIFDNVTHLMDANNRMTRYIYDSKQRVTQVQDQKGNILKVNEYKD